MDEQKECEIFEHKRSIEKNGKALIDGEKVVLIIEDRHFFFNLPKVNDGKNINHQEKKYKLREGCFENDIIKKVKESYCIHFDKEAIKEISIFINEYPQSIFSCDSFRDKLKIILQKHGYTDMHDAIPAYIKYFLIDGLLKKNGSVFEIVRSNLIPRNKIEVNRGFLDELDMS